MSAEELEPMLLTVYRVLELIGVFLAALVGGTVARTMKFDIVGFLIIAVVSALAGGALRDTLINSGLVAALDNPEYVWTAMAGAAVAFVTRLHGFFWTIFHYHADMAILGVWAVTGSTKALLNDVSPLGCVLMGVVTATGGGILRDMMCGQVPSVLKNQQMTVIPAVVAGTLNVGLYHAGYDAWGMIVSPIVAFLLAMLVYWKGWYVPARQDFAPVNDIALSLRRSFSGVEQQLRTAARKVEPTDVRSWRHEKMEEIEDEEDGLTRDEFIDMLYRAYSRSGDDGDTGWVRRT
ncbi:trimeric intracellular cation channel family protein [Corynebacterium sp. Z-1]|uniref:trimeric intracellular cation channel family protein n=1 Tax=Corynebacterium sp. Z-1 TaxID=3074378 RepID=UPI002882E235|nr:trimeric intracellular cation channel family protein [Corynebacterium sp. Z-1]WNI12654.1 trimeric intracellular cation channel family protein [Corynebacterium sp. Z-1]